ncbi:MAG: HAD hydrolase family protein [Planctomycetota bacterium]
MQREKDVRVIRAMDIDLIVYDFDGVMTNNSVIVMQDGTEGVIVNRSDGFGVAKIHSLGIPQLLLSTEANPVVRTRAAKLKLEVINGCGDKKDALLSFCADRGYDRRKVVYVGNDVNDLEAMKVVGFPVAPADAHSEIIKIAQLVTRARGGEGVIRELCDVIEGRK